jgi:Ca-activated chloride channel family protein
VLHDLPHWIDGDALVINVGDLFSGEERKVMFTLSVPALEDQGTSVVADVVLEYTELPAMAEHVVGLPIAINVVPGDEARNRIPIPVVEVERLMTDIDARKRSVSSSLRAGQTADAQRTLAGAIKDLNDKRTEIKTRGADASLSMRLDEAARDLLKLAGDVQSEDAQYAGKSVMNSLNATSRGRKIRGQEMFPDADAS